MTPIEEELKLLEFQAHQVARSQANWAKYWRFVGMWLGLPIALLSGLSGVLILADGSRTDIAAVCAFLAAALGALVGFVDPDVRARKARMLQVITNDYERRVRQIREIDLPSLTDDAARQILDDMTKEWLTIEWDDTADELERRRVH